MRASTHEPSSATVANNRNWPQVRPVSIRMRPSGRPVSCGARLAKSLPIDSMLSAIFRRNAARTAPLVLLKSSNALAANSAALFSSASVTAV